MSIKIDCNLASNEGVTLTIPETRLKAFINPQDGRRWGQAFYDYMQFEKITDPVNKAWCDKLYLAGVIDSRKMVHQILDREN